METERARRVPCHVRTRVREMDVRGLVAGDGARERVCRPPRAAAAAAAEYG